MTAVMTRPDDLTTGSTTTNLSVEDPGTEWAPGSYPLGAEVWKSSTHRKYRAAVDPSTSDDPEVGVLKDPPTWTDNGPTNEWAFKDQINDTQTENADTIVINHTMTNGEFPNSVGIYNMDAFEIAVQLTSVTAGGVFFDETYSLEDNDHITDIFEYLYAGFRINRRALYIDGIQSYIDADITITINNTGGTAKVGNVVIGEQVEIGGTLEGATTPIQDYSRKIVDNFGNTTLKNNGNSKQFRGQVAIPVEMVNYVYNTLSDFASVPVAFSGDKRYSGMNMYGTVSIIPAYTVANIHRATLKCEGLK